MITLLSRLFIKNHENYADASVRSAYGVLCGICGILLNVILFAVKFFAGLISRSVAVTADAFNNLSDAGSSVITLIGFKLAAQKPDEEHPFGHGRFEYVSGLVVSLAILLMGFELAKSSFDKILHPEDVEKNYLVLGILVVSVAVKAYMSLYNRSIGKKIRSSAMLATATDSLSDVVATTVVILSTVVSYVTSWRIDGYCGLAVALFICYAGFNAAKETISPLLGQPPEKEFVEDIQHIVMSYPQVLGIHDLVVHDYGPGRVMVSLHAEVDEKADIRDTHDCIDNIERNLKEKLGCAAVIHMDPIAADDEETKAYKDDVTAFVREKFGEDVTVHDFRLVKGPTHTNLIFDVVLPYRLKLSDETVKNELRSYASAMEGTVFAVVTVERSYV